MDSLALNLLLFVLGLFIGYSLYRIQLIMLKVAQYLRQVIANTRPKSGGVEILQPIDQPKDVPSIARAKKPAQIALEKRFEDKNI